MSAAAAVAGHRSVGHGGLDEMVIGSQLAHRVRARRVAGEQERLAAATTVIDITQLAIATRIRHPIDAAEGIERVRVTPYGRGAGPLEGRRPEESDRDKNAA